MKSIIIAEIGSNWEGDVSKGIELIQQCKLIGADVVKFQMWRASDLYEKNHPLWNFIKKSELTFTVAEKFKKIADSIGIEFMCSAFYPEAVTFLEKLGVSRYKVASRTCLMSDPFSFETLVEKSKTKKPVIISMGMGGDINKIKNIFNENLITFCYCKSEYPLDFSKISWNEAIKFNGFSDHTLGSLAPLLFSILKKQSGSDQIIIEKHVKLPDSAGPDAETSMDINDFKNLINQIRIIEQLDL